MSEMSKVPTAARTPESAMAGLTRGGDTFDFTRVALTMPAPALPGPAPKTTAEAEARRAPIDLAPFAVAPGTDVAAVQATHIAMPTEPSRAVPVAAEPLSQKPIPVSLREGLRQLLDRAQELEAVAALMHRHGDAVAGPDPDRRPISQEVDRNRPMEAVALLAHALAAVDRAAIQVKHVDARLERYL